MGIERIRIHHDDERRAEWRHEYPHIALQSRNRSADGLGWSLTSGAGARATGGLVRGAGGLRELGADRYAPDGCQRQGISSASRAAGCD